MNDNAIIIEAWNTILFDKFVQFRHVLVAGLSGYSDALFARQPFAPGSKIIDIGCGFGDSTLRLARDLGDQSHIVGVDCAENFINAAREEARDAQVENVSFRTADVQFDDLQGPYDYAFARFGTMFFTMPGAAMRNIRKALKPGGEFLQIVWRRREDNPWVHEAEKRVRELIPERPHDDSNDLHCGPGPFSMSGPDMVSGMLKAAGFDRITFERHDTEICIGHDLDDAVEFAMALGPAGEIIRLAGKEGERQKPKVIDALRDALSPYARDDGIWAPSSSWFVSARNP